MELPVREEGGNVLCDTLPSGIANDGGLKSMFDTTPDLHTFQIKVEVEYPEIATKALKSLLAFPVSHLCEAGFFAVKVKGIQSCPALCNPMDCTVHGNLQARILEWVAFPFSRGSSQPRDDQIQVSCIAGGFFTS